MVGHEVKFCMHHFVCGVGKGQFKLMKPAEVIDPKKMVQFVVTDDKSLVVFNGVVTTVGALHAEKSKTDPACKVAYHDMSMQPSPGTFTMTAAASYSIGWTKLCFMFSI